MKGRLEGSEIGFQDLRLTSTLAEICKNRVQAPNMFFQTVGVHQAVIVLPDTYSPDFNGSVFGRWSTCALAAVTLKHI